MSEHPRLWLCVCVCFVEFKNNSFDWVADSPTLTSHSWCHRGLDSWILVNEIKCWGPEDVGGVGVYVYVEWICVKECGGGCRTSCRRLKWLRELNERGGEQRAAQGREFFSLSSNFVVVVGGVVVVRCLASRLLCFHEWLLRKSLPVCSPVCVLYMMWQTQLLQ